MPNKTVHLIDGSHWRWPTPLQALIDNGEQGFITKATEGTTFVDNYYDDWQIEAEKLDYPFGSFHYWRAAYDAQKQAQHYHAIANKIKKPLLPPVIDVEKTNNYGVLSQSAASAHLQLACMETEQLWGEKPWIYTSFYSVKDMLGNPSWLAEYPLWVASYRNDRPSIHPHTQSLALLSVGMMATGGMETKHPMMYGSPVESPPHLHLHHPQSSHSQVRFCHQRTSMYSTNLWE
jgi:GH25 family lysozyme M1 (1,4-beta-N-acetylmuramidase)